MLTGPVNITLENEYKNLNMFLEFFYAASQQLLTSY